MLSGFHIKNKGLLCHIDYFLRDQHPRNLAHFGLPDHNRFVHATSCDGPLKPSLLYRILEGRLRLCVVDKLSGKITIPCISSSPATTAVPVGSVACRKPYQLRRRLSLPGGDDRSRQSGNAMAHKPERWGNLYGLINLTVTNSGQLKYSKEIRRIFCVPSFFRDLHEECERGRGGQE